MAGTGARIALIGGKSVVAAVSLLVLGTTYYGWSTISNAEAGVQHADVIDTKTTPKTPGQDMNILLVGMDSRTDAHGDPLPKNLLDSLHAGPDEGEIEADTLIVVHVPGDGTAASAFSIPRDSWVTIDGENGKDKINAAFGYGFNEAKADAQRRGETDQKKLTLAAMDGGRSKTIRTVEQLTGVSIDHYAEVNLYGFAQISDAVGGVPVCLLKDTYDDMTGARFKAGQQTVQGVTALQFVRQRHGLINELDREHRQQAFLASLAHQMLSTGVLTNPSRLNTIIKAVQNAVVVDSGWQLLEFAGQMQGLSGGSITFNTMPVTNVDGKVGGADVVIVTPSDVQAWVKALFSKVGKQATTSAAPTTTSAAPNSNAAITVDVSNASSMGGLAGRVSTFLVGQGYGKGDVLTANAKRATSLVEYASGDKAAAQKVATALGDLPMAVSSSVSPGHVLVLLGNAYHGPGYGATQGVGGTPQLKLAPTATTTATPDRPQIDASGVTCIP
ncbi:LCP family protein [Kutzneria kofuensis]|uniref:LCP family protein required for cell wall assembly n=1 Tax=Kutzneria kofuensis TaxID=103725 RepID=A0A7W9KI47_9PSEU|nr:LCP family protein [Kutzneria kofuensis]MBB5892994.1 LCP family protein required for cell wall assembly [Kutzneria kofuensis]